MNRRQITLILVLSLLGWSSGALLGLHLHSEGEDHDAHHCRTCLDLMAARTTVAVLSAPQAADQPVICPPPAEPAEMVRVRIAHHVFSSRAPPLC